MLKRPPEGNPPKGTKISKPTGFLSRKEEWFLSVFNVVVSLSAKKSSSFLASLNIHTMCFTRSMASLNKWLRAKGQSCLLLPNLLYHFLNSNQYIYIYIYIYICMYVCMYVGVDIDQRVMRPFFYMLIIF